MNTIQFLKDSGFQPSNSLEALKVTHQAKGDKRYYAQNGKLLGLHLSGTETGDDFWKELKDVQDIEVLYLSRNKFSQLRLKDFKALRFLNVSENPELQSLQLDNCPEIVFIDASFCPKLSQVEIKGSCEHLDYFDIQKTEVSTLKLPEKLSDPSYHNFDNTPFAVEHAAEIEVGWRKIKGLFVERQVPFLHAKLLLLGDTGIGKSNLLHYWKTPNEPYTNDTSTHGLVYEEIEFETADRPEKVCLHVWDFGGQEYFHATHKLFFSGGAINLLLWSVHETQRKGQDDRLFDVAYWLRCIEQLGIDLDDTAFPKTLVVENQIDRNMPPYSSTPQNQEALSAKFKLNLYYHSMALMPEGKSENQPRRLKGLDSLLSDLLNGSYDRPESYGKIYEKIKIETSPIVKTKGLDTDTLKVFHNRGILLYFQEILPDLVFLKPAVFLNFLYASLFGEERKEGNPKITEEEIGDKLQGSPFNKHLTCKDVKNLLQYFDLVFEIPDEPNTFFIPQYLPEKPPVWVDFFEQHHFSFPSVLISSDHYLMNLVMLKLFSEYGKSVKKDGENYLFWQNGIVIEKEKEGKKAILLIKYNRQGQQLELHEDRNNFWLVQEVWDFVESIPEKQARNMENMPEQMSEKLEIMEGKASSSVFDIRLSLDGQWYVSYGGLLKTKRDYINFTEAYPKYPQAGEEKSHYLSIHAFNKYLPKSKQSIMAKLMISYSKQDLSLIEEFKKYLEPLVRDGIIAEPWYCTLLEAGQEWDRTIQHRLETCDVLCFMCSANAFNTDYIKDKEIKPAIARYDTKKDLMIVPIILEPFRWTSENKEINLGRFSALPYIAKPITDFKDRKIAWYIISECLRVAILNRKKDSDFKPEGEDYWASGDGHAKLPKDVMNYFKRIVEEKLDL